MVREPRLVRTLTVMNNHKCWLTPSSRQPTTQVRLQGCTRQKTHATSSPVCEVQQEGIQEAQGALHSLSLNPKPNHSLLDENLLVPIEVRAGLSDDHNNSGLLLFCNPLFGLKCEH